MGQSLVKLIMSDEWLNNQYVWEDVMLNKSRGLELSNKGYLINFYAWNRDFAIELAKENDLDLTDRH